MTATSSGTTRVKRGLVWSATNSVFLRLGNLAMAMVIARLLTPEQFGAFAVALTVQLVLGTLAEFGLGADLIRSKDLERRAPTIATAALATAVVLGGTMALAAPAIAEAFSSPEAAGPLALMSVSVVMSGLSVVPAAVLQRDFQQGKAFAADGAGVVVSFVVTVVLAVSGAGAMSLAWGKVLSQGVTTTLHFVLTARRPRFGLDTSLLRSVAAFGAPLAAANFVSWLLLTVDKLVVARVGGAVLLGFYAMAFNVSSWPMGALGQTIRVIALPGFAQARHSGAARDRLCSTVALTWTSGLFIGLMLAALASPVITVLFGARWSPAATALVGLGVFGGLRVVFDLVATYLIAVGDTRGVLLVQIGWIVLFVPVIYVMTREFGLAGAGWSHLVVGAAFVVPAYAWVLSRSGVAIGPVLRACIVPTLAAAPAGAAAFGLAELVDSPLLGACAGGLAGGGIYAALTQARVRRWLAELTSERAAATQASRAPSPLSQTTDL